MESDLNGDGTIDFQEFLTMMKKKSSEADQTEVRNHPESGVATKVLSFAEASFKQHEFSPGGGVKFPPRAKLNGPLEEREREREREREGEGERESIFRFFPETPDP
jgi:hypothetical protein